MVPISPSTRRKTGRGLLVTALVGLVRRPGRAERPKAGDPDASSPTRHAARPPSASASTTPSTIAPRPEAERSGPVLRWTDDRVAPRTGPFAPCAIANAALTAAQVPTRGEPWERCHEFALSYDGYAYWDDVAELAQRSLARWVRDGSLPVSLDELRACLFYEQRRWHHFGDVPSGRSLDYGWALADAIRALVAPAASLSAADPAPVTFLDDDDGFSAWVAGHPAGYVLNAARPSSGRAAKLHRVGCPAIPAGAPAATGNGDRPKKARAPRVCAPDAPSLAAWASAQTGSAPDPCKRCKP